MRQMIALALLALFALATPAWAGQKEAITHEPKEVVIRFTLQEREALRRVVRPEWTPTGKMFCRTEAP